MLQEVLSRIDLIISVQGSRKISKENLEFMFEKYELSDEECEQVFNYCREKRIDIFEDSLIPGNNVEEETQVEKQEEKAPEPKKKGFLARLFGK